MNGVTSVDGRNTTNLPAFKGTDYQRPEDMQIQTVHGRAYLYVTTTTTNEVYRLDLGKNTISIFANRNNMDGDLTVPGEGIGRWASNGMVGSEFTGLYFDPFNMR